MKHIYSILGSTLLSIFVAVFCFSLFAEMGFALEVPIFNPEKSGQETFVPTENEIIDPTNDTPGGHRILAEVMLSVIGVIKTLLAVIAIAFIVYSGMLLVIAGGSEDQVEKGKRGAIWGILGLVFVLLADNVITNVLYGGRDFAPGETLRDPETIRTSIDNGTLLMLDALNWAQSIIIIGAVGFLIFSGARMIAALGDEEVITKQRTTFLWIGAGIVVILLNSVLIQEVIYPRVLGDNLAVQYSPNTTKGIEETMSLIKYFLQFLGVLAFLAFVYGGGRMIFAFGNDEAVEEGKKALIGGIIGVLIVLVSFVLVSSLIQGSVGK